MSLCFFRAKCAIVIYGGIMNLAAILIWAHEINREQFITSYVTGFPINVVHAVTWVFLWFAAELMMKKLDRIKVKYELAK